MGSTEREIRSAAEALLGSSSSNPVRPVPGYNSINSVVLTDEIYTGLRQSGQMSVVRRFFCLFVTFDLLFTFFMWLICIMLTGDDIFTALTQQILRYNVHTSLFDIVMSSIVRFTVLLLFYGCLYINHWSIIALSTAGTCAFLIAKVFVYDWVHAAQPVFQVLLVLTTFVLSWGEAWFLDFRVIPQELQALRFVQGPGSGYMDDERGPLTRNYIDRMPHYSEPPESYANFYSPMDSPEGSEDEEDGRRPGRAHRAKKPAFVIKQPMDEAEMKEKGKEVLDQAWTILNLPEWKLERETSEGDLIHSKTIAKGVKVFRLTATVDFPPKFLLTELYHNIENFPKWNPTLKESQRVQVIDEHTDIYYQVAAGGGGGIVSSRDFVNLRHWGEQEGCYVSSACSIVFPDIPPQSKYTRGENGPSCWVMRPIPGEDKRCVFQWLLNVNLHGWIPQYVLDPAFTASMVDYMVHMRNYAVKLNKEGAF